MEYGIINAGVVACRAKAKHSAEQVNQLLFGETYSVLKKTKEWLKVKSTHDNYEGWIHHKQHLPVSKNTFQKYNQKISLTLDLLGSVKEKNEFINIPLGSTLQFFHNKELTDGNSLYTYKGKIASQKKADLLKYTRLYLNTPYLWGGRTPLGIDCSGFVQMSFKLCGIQLPRDAWQQEQKGKKIKSLSQAKTGDLVFFGNEKINHVGIIIANNKVMHSSGKVKTDWLDETGIYCEKTQTYTHQLKSIKRI